MGIRCRRVQINSKRLKILVVPGNLGRPSILKTIHRTPQTTTKGSVVGRLGLDFGIHNESLRPSPLLLGENRGGHFSDFRYYPRTRSHSDALVPLRVVHLSRYVSPILICLLRYCRWRPSQIWTITPQKCLEYSFSQELLHHHFWNVCETFD